jgi:branched-subunit amino acid transport protein
MTWEDFWIITIGCTLAMWACRVIPLFLLKGKQLPPRVAQALGFIPPAAFAALVANDLLNPGMFDAGLWPAAIPFVAAVAAALVAVKSKSLLWTAVAGCAVYAALVFFA